MPLVYVNRAFTEGTAYTPSQVLGRSPSLLQGLFTDRSVALHLDRAMRAGKRHSCTLLCSRRDGTPFFDYLTVLPVWEPAGGAGSGSGSDGGEHQWYVAFYVGLHFVPSPRDPACALQLLALEALLMALPVEVGDC
jgi:hypothetical protein